MSKIRSCAVIAAAGSGRRMGGIDKPNITLLGKTLFEYVLGAVNDSFIDEVVVVCSEDNELLLKSSAQGFKKPIRFVLGGETRADSVFNGISAASEDTEIICVHDCARPFITKEIIEATVDAASVHGASCVCAPVTDTVKYKDPETGTVSTPDRNNMFAVQTPQCFKKTLYYSAVKAAGSKIRKFTDETSLLESIGIEVCYIKHADINMKLTAKSDIPLAEAIAKALKQRRN